MFGCSCDTAGAAASVVMLTAWMVSSGLAALAAALDDWELHLSQRSMSCRVALRHVTLTLGRDIHGVRHAIGSLVYVSVQWRQQRQSTIVACLSSRGKSREIE